MKQPNVLWIMSDQHNARCMSCTGHPVVKTPSLDRIASRGVHFTSAFANNPICSPSRISFMTGQYIHSHGMLSNSHSEYEVANPDTLACVFRRSGYQTALIGKSHMVRKWDQDGFEHIRYTDLCDSLFTDPLETHYFRYLVDKGLGDLYEEGSPAKGDPGPLDGSRPAHLPYEHTIERFTGRESLAFLRNRDTERPFFLQMSFQRPHDPITPSEEHFGMYDPDSIPLPDNAIDWFENKFSGKPAFMQKLLSTHSVYPMADQNPSRLRRAMASYFALISVIDSEIGLVLDQLEESGELDSTVVFYTADHGDFAGEHGLMLKNLGIYDSIQRIPFILSWPGGPHGITCDKTVESVDWYTTLCSLCGIDQPEGRDGTDLVPVVAGNHDGRDAAFCEWEWPNPGGRISSIRNDKYRLVSYEALPDGELYDQVNDPGEIHNLWNAPEHTANRDELLLRLHAFSHDYEAVTNMQRDVRIGEQCRDTPKCLIQKQAIKWTEVLRRHPELENHCTIVPS